MKQGEANIDKNAPAKKLVDEYISNNQELIDRVLKGTATAPDAGKLYDYFKQDKTLDKEDIQKYFLNQLNARAPGISNENLHKLCGLLLDKEFERTATLTPPDNTSQILRTTTLARTVMMYEAERYNIGDDIYMKLINIKGEKEVKSLIEAYVNIEVNPNLKDHFNKIYKVCNERGAPLAAGQSYIFNVVDGQISNKLKASNIPLNLQNALTKIRRKVVSDIVYPDQNTLVPHIAKQESGEARHNAQKVVVAQFSEGIATTKEIKNYKVDAINRGIAYLKLTKEKEFEINSNTGDIKELKKGTEGHGGKEFSRKKLEPIKQLLDEVKGISGKEMKGAYQPDDTTKKEPKGFFAAIFKFFRSESHKKTEQHKPEQTDWKGNEIYENKPEQKPAVQSPNLTQKPGSHAEKHAPKHFGKESPLGKRLHEENTKQMSNVIEQELGARGKWEDKHKPGASKGGGRGGPG